MTHFSVIGEDVAGVSIEASRTLLATDMLHPEMMQYEIITGAMELEHLLSHACLELLQGRLQIRHVGSIELELTDCTRDWIDIAAVDVSTQAKGFKYRGATTYKRVQYGKPL
ncbi:hypothetical protein C1X72_24580 [Pseudomonas sp. FW306-2-2C-D06B]|nr:hypothetical protein C1X72_24580 [Pseudomonas sp. FW306-2-2C-D06B]